VNDLTKVNEMSAETEPRAPSSTEVVVKDLETLRVLSDPLRMRMVDLMSRGEWTVKQVAAALGVGQTRLYHHVALLEAHGLLRVTGTRLVSGIVEKRYAAPSQLTVDHRLFLGGDDAPADVARAVDGLVATAFATVRQEIERSIAAGKIALDSDTGGNRGVTLTFDGARLSESAALEFRARLETLLREFSELDEPESNGSAEVDEFRLLVGFFRAARKPDARADSPR
jgi:DNA-binding transcriptional ArsR family regulator